MIVSKAAVLHLVRHAISESIAHALVSGAIVGVMTFAVERILDTVVEALYMTCAVVLVLAGWKHLTHSR
jgi:hypothetical protein